MRALAETVESRPPGAIDKIRQKVRVCSRCADYKIDGSKAELPLCLPSVSSAASFDAPSVPGGGPLQVTFRFCAGGPFRQPAYTVTYLADLTEVGLRGYCPRCHRELGPDN